MKRTKTISTVILFFIFFSLSCTKTVDEVVPEDPEYPTLTKEEELLAIVNQYRLAGCKCGDQIMPPTTPLTLNEALNSAAKVHADDMVKNNFFSHTGSDGSSVGARLRKLGYMWSACGENIAKFGGFTPSSEYIIGAWIKSPGHCKNIMHPAFREMGIANSGAYYVQVFGAK